jgi:hypothetical protein
MKHILILSTFMALLTGCGGGGGGSSSGSATGSSGSSFNARTVLMDIGEAYDVYPGDKLVKNSEAAIVTISHIDGQQSATIVLKDGNASIIYK